MVLLEAGRIHEAFDFVDLSRANLLKYFEKVLRPPLLVFRLALLLLTIATHAAHDTRHTPISLVQFMEMDADHSGEITYPEFVQYAPPTTPSTLATAEGLTQSATSERLCL
jgi:hypothetical protein